MSEPLQVGVTGGIGSGKTTVCKIVEILGSKVYYSDDRAKQLMNEDESLKKNIVELFGEKSYQNERLNRSYLADKIFKDETMREALNNLVHPSVDLDYKKWLQHNQDDRLLFKEAALLFETGFYLQLDKTILITAPIKTRIQRVQQRDPHRSKQQIQAIIEKQNPESVNAALADIVLENDGHHSVIRQTVQLYEELIK
ncbi:MAG: dephospho-CoA kinase [Bacteroidota bacterium]